MRNIALLSLLLIVLSACNIFGLRDSEFPSEEAQWNNSATTLDLALNNLHLAYEDARNSINYERIFHSDYIFRFAEQDIADYGIEEPLNQANERDMILNLHARYKDIQVTLQDYASSDVISANEAKLYRVYELKATSTDSRQEQTIASGRMELHYLRQGGYWYIYRWDDYRSSSERTWGLLKHENG